MASKSAAAKKLPVVQQEAELYMSDEHVAEFRGVLARMLVECATEARETMQALREEYDRPPDAADLCDINLQKEEKRHLADRLMRRHGEIEAAVRRLESGDFGYCEETGDEIGLPRLRANPLARLCIEAASRREHLNRMHAP